MAVQQSINKRHGNLYTVQCRRVIREGQVNRGQIVRMSGQCWSNNRMPHFASGFELIVVDLLIRARPPISLLTGRRPGKKLVRGRTEP